MGLYRKGLGLLIVAGTAFPWAAMSTEVVVEVYPKRPITLVVGFPPGGGADVVARQLATFMTEDLGQKVLIENRPGASGNIGAAAVAKAAADGYTVYLAVRPVALHKVMFKGVDYDFAKDLIPVGMVVRVPYVLVMSKHVPATNLKRAFELVRARPGGYTCASPGLGSTNHLLCEDLKDRAFLGWEHIPYSGEAPVMVDVAGGRADFGIVSVTAALPFINSGHVLALAVFSTDRVPVISSVLRMAELGFAHMEAQGWCAIVAPAGTPPHVVSRLNRSINAALSNVSFRRKLTRLGYVVPGAGNTPESLGTFLAEDVDRWTKLLIQKQVTGLQ
ncbi:tripartite tricarboxylate transporter substrate binding protein [Bordetella sp. N]|uniref:Bug family tripartite tricarboxylate transporter substrate binding protein n=1 Tax=Bordetella sp. N TaxID=1746199 RepID=UPI00070D20BB|nr:tripartite tricarboxylate transporter substrate-binding protein [Bordetella sp. N]ALM82324.1 hypothetical protein ASB57_04520 [Bordetella sp. N]